MRKTMLWTIGLVLGLCPVGPNSTLVKTSQEGTANSQEQQSDSSRQIVLEEFTRVRPTAASNKAPASAKTGTYRKPVAGTATKAPRYMRKTPPLRSSLNPGQATMEIGVTIWRLRPSTGTDSGARMLVMENTQSTQWTPERVEADTLLRVGERVRISIESPRAGYLYVIDREQYADGSKGDAYLIFPTLRTRGGDNQVRAGKLIDVPAQEDNPSYLTIVPGPGRSDQVAEVLNFIVTPEPLENFRISDNPLRLLTADIEKWEKLWSGEVERFEMVGGAGSAWTSVEKEASSVASSRFLTQEEPGPQTIYRVTGLNKNALFVTVPLRYRR
jgi:hypothetical protein